MSADHLGSLPLGSGLDVASGTLYSTGSGGGSTGTQVQSLQGSSATQIQTFSITGGVYNAALYAVMHSTSFSNSTITFASIALINTSTENTPSPFQQFIDVPSITMANANATLTNVQFSDPSGATIIPSWRESGTVNNENAHYWLLMEQGVPASSTIYAIVQYFKNGSNILNAGTTGLAPTLPEFYDQSYGTNDTGTIVFPELYDNYAGSLLNTIWTSQGTGNVTVNNVLNVGGGNNTYTFVASTLAFTYPIVAENFVNTNTTGGDPRFYYVGLATSTVLNTTGLANNSYVDYINSYAMFNTQIMGYGISGGLPQIVSTISNVTGTLQQIGIAWDSSSPLQTMYVDDVATVVANSSSVTIGNYNMFVGQANGGVGSGTITVQYSRVRAYPPSGTAMPTNSLSQSVTSTVTMGVNYNDPTIGYTSIYPISTITLTSAEKTSYTVPISTGSGSITISYIGNGAYFSYRVG